MIPSYLKRMRNIQCAATKRVKHTCSLEQDSLSRRGVSVKVRDKNGVRAKNIHIVLGEIISLGMADSKSLRRLARVGRVLAE